MSEPKSLQEMLDAANVDPTGAPNGSEEFAPTADVVAAEALDSISESLAEVDENDPDTVHTVVSTLRETNKILREFLEFLKERF